MISRSLLHDTITSHFRFNIDADYRLVRNCNEYMCDSICRCGKLEDIEIVDIGKKYSATSIVKSYNTAAKRKRTNPPSLLTSEFDVYCLDRMLSTLSPDHVEANVVSGYYGEEIDGYDIDTSLLSSIYDVLSLASDTEKMEAILTYEYGYVLPILKNAKYEIVKVDRKSLEAAFSNDNYHANIIYDSKIETDPDIPIGLYRKLSGGDYALVDGYHRFIEHIVNGKKKKLKVIIASSN